VFIPECNDDGTYSQVTHLAPSIYTWASWVESVTGEGRSEGRKEPGLSVCLRTVPPHVRSWFLGSLACHLTCTVLVYLSWPKCLSQLLMGLGSSLRPFTPANPVQVLSV
jgi:hypothetical protein